jgi:enamine deaminase RidA (YjgF/YER057c/UK114 family)
MTVKRTHKSSPYQASRSYSPVVVTEGGRTIWLAGIIAAEDEQGRSLAGDFDGQVRCVFRKMAAALGEVNATLADVVTMTTYITDARDNGRFVELRKEFFTKDFPASTLVTVAALNRAEYKIEVTAVAVAD